MEPEVTRKLEEDVSFVRQAVEQREKGEYRSLAITILWAVIIGVGYALNDFAMDYVPLYWMTAPAAGFLVSLGLGLRDDRKRGLRRPGLSARHALHWGTIFFGGAAVIFIAMAHRLDGWVIGQLFALLTGAVFFLGGLHLDRRTLWPGVLLIGGAAAVDHIQPWPWTIVGLATAAALVASALWMKPKDEQAVAAG